MTREHIFLVFISTGVAILIGVPLGILEFTVFGKPVEPKQR